MARLLLSCFAVSAVLALDNGLGRTPAMGYNTWNDFRCDDINSTNIMLVADKMAALKLQDHGYKYINIDDCWAVSRDNATNEIIADPKAFPNGVKAVSDYVHSKGFLFGIYTDRGTMTCARRPGSLGFETVDANTYAKWGVDYLKEDSCYAREGGHDTAFEDYAAMRDALNKTGRPIYFSLCGWNNWYAPPGWGLGNSWRVSGDVNEWPSVWNSVSINSKLAAYARPGGWNDPDMLVGSTESAAVHLTPTQSRTQFSLWSIMAAPLLIGSNILHLSDFDVETYTNDEVIAVDQDALGVQGTIIWDNCPIQATEVDKHGAFGVSDPDVPECQQVWAKRLKGGDYALSFVNWATTASNATCDSYCFETLGFQGGASVRDLWAHRDLGTMSSITAKLEANGGSVVYRLKQPRAGAVTPSSSLVYEAVSNM